MARKIITIASIFIGMLVLAVSNWRIRSLVFSAALQLPHAENDTWVERALKMTTPDGVTLVGDLFRPKKPGNHPVIVIRTAYGRKSAFNGIFSNFFAHRGYNVFVQDVRGTGDSDGEFVPLSNEKKDGKATIDWIEQQPWFNGQVVTFGLSYLGFTSNAIAVHNLPSVKAVFSAITPRTFRDILYGTDGFDFNTTLQWTVTVDALKKANYEDPGIKETLQGMLGTTTKEQIPFDALPVASADTVATGAPVDFYQTFVNSADPAAPFWSESRLTEEEIAGIEVPMFLSSSWHDTALPEVLRDYQSLKSAGKIPRLTICSGPHGNVRAIPHYLRDAKTWFDHYLKGKPLTLNTKRAPLSLGSKPVQFNILNTKEWVEADSWPIPTAPKRLYLVGNNTLAEKSPDRADGFTSYVFDPMYPTPAVGGNLLETKQPIVDNTVLEARADTLVFTAPAFEETTYIIGEIKTFICFETNVETSDLFVRVNRVSHSGKSENVTDAIQRIFFDSGNGGYRKIELALIPTAVRFERGDQLRVVIASGAHPRIARNFGSGSTQDQAFMTEGQAATIKIHHSAEFPSYIELPSANQFIQVVRG